MAPWSLTQQVVQTGQHTVVLLFLVITVVQHSFIGSDSTACRANHWRQVMGWQCLTFAFGPRSTTFRISRSFWSQIRAVVRYLQQCNTKQSVLTASRHCLGHSCGRTLVGTNYRLWL